MAAYFPAEDLRRFLFFKSVNVIERRYDLQSPSCQEWFLLVTFYVCPPLEELTLFTQRYILRDFPHENAMAVRVGNTCKIKSVSVLAHARFLFRVSKSGSGRSERLGIGPSPLINEPTRLSLCVQGIFSA
jgi:hypothetical protein